MEHDNFILNFLNVTGRNHRWGSLVELRPCLCEILCSVHSVNMCTHNRTPTHTYPHTCTHIHTQTHTQIKTKPLNLPYIGLKAL